MKINKPDKNPIALKINIFLIIGILLSAPPIYCIDEDLSTPENTVETFIKGYITGDKELSRKCLKDGSNLGDTGFGIPFIKSYKIIEKREIDPATMYGEAGDVEIIVEEQFIPEQIGRFWYLLRKFGDEWKIIDHAGELVTESGEPIETEPPEHPDFPKEFSFVNDKDTYLIFPNGDGTVQQKGEKPKKFKIPIGKGVRIRSIYHVEYEKDMIFIYEYVGFDFGGGGIVRLDMKTLKPKWQAQIWSGNIEKYLLHEKYLYITGKVFEGKIDLDTGKYVWKRIKY